MNREEIIDILESFAPIELQEDWDNSGWQIKSKKTDINRVLVCVSPTIDVLEQAIEKDIDLIISHHPLIFPNITRIDNEFINLAIKNDIQLYSMHTNFDKAGDGTSSYLANELGFTKLEKFNDYVQITELEKVETIEDIVSRIKQTFNLTHLKVIGYNPHQEIRKIAFCAGSGGEFLEKIHQIDVALYITSDVKYHNEVKKSNCAVIDIDHMTSERPALKKIFALLNEQDIKVLIADEKCNITYI